MLSFVTNPYLKIPIHPSVCPSTDASIPSKGSDSKYKNWQLRDAKKLHAMPTEASKMMNILGSQSTKRTVREHQIRDTRKKNRITNSESKLKMAMHDREHKDYSV